MGDRITESDFRSYLAIAKELGVSRFKLTADGMEAEFAPGSITLTLPKHSFDDIMKDIPSDEKLLGIEEPVTDNLGNS